MDKFFTYHSVRLHYTDCGEGHPLLLLHGWGCNTTTFSAIRPFLEARFRVLTLDFAERRAARGVGRGGVHPLGGGTCEGRGHRKPYTHRPLVRWSSVDCICLAQQDAEDYIGRCGRREAPTLALVLPQGIYLQTFEAHPAPCCRSQACRGYD